MGFVTQNLEYVRKTIDEAVKRCGREDYPVLVAVSKTKPVELLQEAYDCGVRDFGENKVQELCGKMEAMPEDIRWHMIGHLQKNKVKYIAQKVYMIHGVDSLELAKEIEKQAAKYDRIISILIEVNIGGEESKFGIRPEEVEKLVRSIADFKHVQIKGLMCIPPHVCENSENRQYFASMKQLSVDILQKNIDNITMSELSMGMSDDYAVAIEEGATLIRVGTGIFGERAYKIEGER